MNITAKTKQYFLTTSEVQRIRELREKGHAWASIARWTGRSLETVKRYADDATAERLRKKQKQRRDDMKHDPQWRKDHSDATRRWRENRRKRKHAAGIEAAKYAAMDALGIVISDDDLQRIVKAYTDAVAYHSKEMQP